MTLDFLTEDDITILDKAYESYGGLSKYLEMELKGKLNDYIKESQWKLLDVETLKQDVLNDIEAEKILIKEENVE